MGRTIRHCIVENCSASFDRSDRYEIHLRHHNSEKPFCCSYDECEKSFASESHLKRHENSHKSPISCPEKGCMVVLKTKESLGKHLDLIHHNTKPKKFKCSTCGKDFNKRNWLTRHMFVHTSIAPYKCPADDCGRSFLFQCKFKKHLKVHAGYDCQHENCKEQFSKWSLLVKHKKEKHPIIHKCEVCEKEFLSSSNLKSHVLTHSNERTVFPCEVNNCGRFYFAKKNLAWHVKSYHEKRPFVCRREQCFKSFKSEGELAKHLLYHDRKRPPRRKKKHKPSMAALLAGCVEPRKVEKQNSIQTEANEENSYALCDTAEFISDDTQTAHVL